MPARIKAGGLTIGQGEDLVLIAGPCVIETRENCLKIAERLKAISVKLDVPLIFKASYDKANRSSLESYRGPGIQEGLKILSEVREEMSVPVLSDVHTPEEAKTAKEVLDVLQVPAFLSRQTDLIVTAAASGKAINIKKGQFLSPREMENVVKKAEAAGSVDIMLTERGTSFGYNMLVNDFRALMIMRQLGYPVVYDATHSVQCPGGRGASSGGESEYVEPLSLAAVATGCCDAIFIEVQEDPAKAKSDGPNMLKLDQVESYLRKVKHIFNARKQI